MKKNLHIHKEFWYALIVFGVAISMVILVRINLLKDQQKALKNEVLKKSENIIYEIEKILNDNLTEIENFKNLLEETEGAYMVHWDFEANHILQQNPSIKFLEWINQEMIITRISPLEGNEHAHNLDISGYVYRAGEWRKHTEQNTLNITPWALLTQGGEAFLVDFPVYVNSELKGTVTGGLDFTPEFNILAEKYIGYYIRLEDERGISFYSINDKQASKGDEVFLAQQKLVVDEPDGQYWTLYVLPLQQVSTGLGLEILNQGVIMGFILSLMLGLLVYFYLSTKREAKLVVLANKNLRVLNESLEKARNKAERASLSKTEFLSNMSHEIRTPLNGIIGITELLREETGKLKREDYLNMLEYSSKNLLSLVNDILDFDKIESGKMRLKKDVFNPWQELEKLTEVYKVGVKEKNLELITTFFDREPLYVEGDSGKFIQIITNLLRNALKFTQKGKIEIQYAQKVSESELKITIQVKDTGIGIPSEKQKLIFERFTQVEGGFTKKHEGTGLGLAISSQLTALMGGKLSLQSEIGKGSIFTLKLSYPLKKDRVEALDAPSALSPKRVLKNVLIVEDNPLNVLVLKQQLKLLNISSEVAGDGLEAVEMAIKNDYSLIFMDIHMPNMDGIEATKNIRKNDTEVIVVALSANVTKETMDEALQSGMNDYMTKPFTGEKLKSMITQYFLLSDI